MKQILLASIFFLVFPGTAEAQEASQGGQGQPCYGNQSCNTGLACDTQANLCETPQETTTGQNGGACYGNQTCNQGLSCDASLNRCVAALPQATPLPQRAPATIPPSAPPVNVPAAKVVEPGYEYHQGMMYGGGLGVTSWSCSDCEREAAIAFDVHAGGFIQPRIALMYYMSGLYDSKEYNTYSGNLTLTLHSFAAQYWISPSLWVMGGAGLARQTSSGSGFSSTVHGVGLTTALGYEVLQSNAFALDISGRINLMEIDDVTLDSISLMLGAHFY